MGKTLGYSREYRARRKANNGQPLGRSSGSSEESDIQVLMRDYGYSRAKAVQETRYVNEQIRLATQIAQGDLSGIAPKGRAPRGLGEEWRARRQIADILDLAESRGNNARARNRTYRGTKQGRYDYSRRNQRADLLPYVTRQATEILRGPGSWKAKASAIRGEYEYASGMIE